MEFTILHTNDIHSNYENYARIVTAIKELKTDTTIILDGGDFTDFSRKECIGSYGKITAEMLKIGGYDAITIGNDETNQGLDMLDSVVNNDKVVFLSANMVTKDDQPLNNVKNSIIIKRNNIRFLIIGLSPKQGVFADMLNFKIYDYQETIKKELDSNQGLYDVAILLSHIGTKKDKKICEEITGIDIIISAHDHKTFEEARIINGIINNSAGCNGDYLGYIKIGYDNGLVKLIDSKTIIVKEYEEDKEVLSVLENNRLKAKQNLNTEIAYLKHNLWHDVFIENPMTNLLADGLRQTFACDIGLINSGIISGGLSSGKVIDERIIEILPSQLNPTLFKIKGKYLKEALELSLNYNICQLSGKAPGFRGRYLGRLHISGATIYYKDEEILNIKIGNDDIEHERVYSVASSDHLQRGTGYYPLSISNDVIYEIDYTRNTLRKALKSDELVSGALVNRWIEIE